MATFVLVHGAWHGGWCWHRVRTALQRAGHDVFTPTLTGVADRSHLNSPQVTLETHVADVVVAKLAAHVQRDPVRVDDGAIEASTRRPASIELVDLEVIRRVRLH